MKKSYDWKAALIILALLVLFSSILYKYIKNLKNESQPPVENFIDYYKAHSNMDYDIIEVDGFMTPEECDTIIRLAKDNLEPSRVYSDKADLNDPKYRISEQAWVKNGSHKTVDDFDNLVSAMTGLPKENHEELQVVRYEKGGFFSPHYDACEGEKDFCDRMNSTGGSRYWTFLVYLNDDFEGGETVFPQLGKSVKPKKGKLVIFQDTDTDGEIIPKSFHGGEPVKNGVKWVCNKWVRHREYR
jgi:prolyl 4-hydroxylase